MIIHEVSFDFGYSSSMGGSTSDVRICGEIRDFNIENYQNIDSVYFGAYLYNMNTSAACRLEIIDITHSKVIEGTLIMSTSTSKVWVGTSTNFIKNIPAGKMNIGLRLESVYHNSEAMFLAPVFKLIQKQNP